MIVEPARPEEDGRYLDALASCFGGWGGEREFDFYFRRPFDGAVADRFVISDEGEWIAGSAVSWRSLADGEERPRRIGIMTGSWTLPPARGRGCFQTIIEHSRRLCVARGADWLLAFVTQDNASRRRLEAAGSLMIPSLYLWSPEGAAAPAEPGPELVEVEADAGVAEDLWRRHAALGAGASRFRYRSAQIWADQFLRRPLPTVLLEAEGLGTLVIERHPVFDRLLSAIPRAPGHRIALERAAWSRALRSGRRFFAFTGDPAHAAALREACALDGNDGFITLLPAASAAPTEAGAWRVESGDRV